VRRVVVRRPGGYDRLEIESAPDPEPGPGEIRIAVEAIGVNFADGVVRMGLYAAAKALGFPITPGFEVAGRVDRVGEGVTEPARGDLVLALTRFGAYATSVVVPREHVFAVPAGRTAVEAAAFPVAFLTAWYALHELAAVRPGARVLVHSAAGGVGGALVELAILAGATVVGVVGSPAKVEAARSLGAHVVVDRSSERWERAARGSSPGGFDAVFDASGPDTLRKSYALLAPTGRLVTYGFASMLRRGSGRPAWIHLFRQWLRTPRFDPMDLTTSNRAVLGFNLAFLFERTDLLARAMADLLPRFASGDLRSPPIRTYPLERAADAQRDLESGSTIGKLVLVPQ
jgi:NADPH:quinone reductase-like Zn-dependent oxidoreductase